MFKKRMNPYLNPNQDLNANPNMSSPEMNTFANPGQQMMPEEMNDSQPLNDIMTPNSFLQDRMYGMERPQPAVEPKPMPYRPQPIQKLPPEFFNDSRGGETPPLRGDRILRGGPVLPPKFGMPSKFKDLVGSLQKDQVTGLQQPEPLNPPKEPVEQVSAQPVPPPTNKAPRAGTGRFGNVKRTLMPR